MNVVYTRSNAVNPDPRVEKEVAVLLEAGHSVSILAWDRDAGGDADDKAIFINGVEVPIIRFRKKAVFGAGLSNLKALIAFQFFLMWCLFKDRNGIDVIHAADFDTLLPAVVMKFFFKKKVVYDVYDFYVDAFSVPRRLKGLVRRIDLYLMAYVDAVVLTNESRREQIKEADPKRLIYIHNTPSDYIPSSALSTVARASDGLVLAYVGVLQEYRLLKEVVSIFERNPNWTLIIAGFGLYERFMHEASSRLSNVHFKEKVSYAEGISISHSADVLFAMYDPSVPNHKYSSPNKLYEAMMLSKPILVSVGTGIDEVVKSENIGLSVPYDLASFEQAVHFLSCNAQVVKDMGARSRQLYDDLYSWAIMSARLKQLYEEI